MKRLLLPLLAALALPTAVNAEVDPKVHKMCLAATDYIGCIKAQSGQSIQPRMTIDQGVSLVEGNSCPESHAYVGGGTCKEVRCVGSGKLITIGKSDPLLRNKNWVCKGFSPLARFGYSTTRAFNDPNCPVREPSPGWKSTCDEEIGPIRKKKKPLACRNGVWDESHPMCKDEEQKITSPMDMD